MHSWRVGCTQQDGITPVELGEQHRHILAARSGNVLAHIVGAQWQLTMPAVDEDGELNNPGTTEVAQRVQGGTHGATREQHVIDEHDQSVVDTPSGNRGLSQRP